jgi:hypothetical protein
VHNTSYDCYPNQPVVDVLVSVDIKARFCLSTYNSFSYQIETSARLFPGSVTVRICLRSRFALVNLENRAPQTTNLSIVHQLEKAKPEKFIL